MRLLKYNNSNLELTDNLDHDIPRYAILSHTWGSDNEEVTYQDLVDRTGNDKLGYDKIKFCAAQAERDGLQHFWIDTCCIDKSNQAELNRAIKSMFRWYQNAACCYVYLSDVSASGYERDDQQSGLAWESAFRKSRWFKRGWTLQELLAPVCVKFFEKGGKQLGDKRSLEQQIHAITGIAVPALQGKNLTHFSIEERFRWAGPRQTSREEDWAYCLQGIFGVSMPVTYGEGKTDAIGRLHNEIKENQECITSLRSTDPRVDKERIEQTKGGLLKESYGWILENRVFQHWKDDDRSRLLWIKGDPGKGKTMLLCGIIDELEKGEGTKAGMISYFFCQATDARINNATAILRGLIYLLVDQHQSLISYIRKEYDRAGKQLFQDANAWNILSSILNKILQDPGLRTTYLVIDALDECITDLPKLLDLITRYSAVTPTVKWIISSRNWPNIDKALSKAAHGVSLSLELNEESVSAAVATYIGVKVEGLSEKNDYDKSTQDNVKRYLASNANGTFLWVALVCQELAEIPGWAIDKGRLAAFPPGLDSLYRRMTEHIRSSRHAQLCLEILSALSIVRRPIELDELPALVKVPPGASSNHKALAEIIGYCGSFLTLRDQTIFFVHQSARDYISKREQGTIDPSREAIAHEGILLSSITAMSQTLRRDIYSLRHPGIIIDEIQPPNPDPLAPIRYACVYWVDHLCEIQDIRNKAAIDSFLKAHLLHWFEALSLIRSTSAGVLGLLKLVNLLEKIPSQSQLLDLARDMYRFAKAFYGIIDRAPLQIYVSALIFSPTLSLIRNIFNTEQPDWIIRVPFAEQNWNACISTLEGHSGWVRSIAFSPDGRRVASGSDDKTVKIWDAETSTCISTLKGHSSWVKSVAFSPDGRRVASGSSDKTVKIWDIEGGVYISTLKGHSSYVNSIAFSPDGRRVASGSDDKTVKIWDTETSTCISTLEGHSNRVNSIAFSPDGRRVASGSADKTVKIWDAETSTCISTLEGHSDWVNSIAFSPDGRRVASGSDDKTVKIWDAETSTCISTLEGHSNRVNSIAFSPDGRRVASGSDDKTVKIWDAETSTCISTLEVRAVIHKLQFDSTGLYLSTNEGIISLDIDLPITISQAIAIPEQLRRYRYSVSACGSWVTWHSQKVLWLPADVRPTASDVFQQTIYIGCSSGRVWNIEFSVD